MLSPTDEFFAQIGAEPLITTKNFIVAKKSDIYIGVPHKLREVYFLKFRSRPNTRSETGEPPKLMPWSKWLLLKNLMKPLKLDHITKKIDDVTVVRIQGKLKIPISFRQIGDNKFTSKYLEGSGMLYSAIVRVSEPGANTDPQYTLEKLGKDRCLRIIEELTSETVKGR